MKDNEIMFTSEDGKWRVRYSMWDLGAKYSLQRLENGHWRYVNSYESALAALTAMKRAANEWA